MNNPQCPPCSQVWDSRSKALPWDLRTPTARHSLELAQNHQGTREPHLSTFLAACSPQVLSGRGHARRQTAKRIPSPARSNAPKIHRSANGGGRSARRQPSIPMAAQSGQCVHWTTRLVPCPTQAGASRSASTRTGCRAVEKNYRELSGVRTYTERGTVNVLARQVLDAKAAGSTLTQAALAHAVGVAPAIVSKLSASDKLHAPPPSATYEMLLRLNEDSPALVCMQEGRVIGETSIESHNRCSRNFKKRQAVLRVAAEAAAARAAEVKHIEMPAHLYRHANTTCPKRMHTPSAHRRAGETLPRVPRGRSGCARRWLQPLVL
jgi:hypothetical protein